MPSFALQRDPVVVLFSEKRFLSDFCLPACLPALPPPLVFSLIFTLGQYLGSRSDFVPAAWCEKLKGLQDRVPAVSFERIEATLKDSFRVNKTSQLFTSFSRSPLASATIAQVHRAELRDGTDVVVKTQYDDQEALCRMDLRNLRQLASFLQKHDMSFFDLDAVVTEMELQIPAEFDFVGEAVSMTLIAENMQAAGLHDVIIPRAIPGMVTRRTLVMVRTTCPPCAYLSDAFLKAHGISHSNL